MQIDELEAAGKDWRDVIAGSGGGKCRSLPSMRDISNPCFKGCHKYFWHRSKSPYESSRVRGIRPIFRLLRRVAPSSGPEAAPLLPLKSPIPEAAPLKSPLPLLPGGS